MNKSRYFLISYTGVKFNYDSTTIYGLEANINIEGKFFNHNEFRTNVVAKHDFLYKSVVITSIFEFQSEEDFNEFVR